MNTPSSHRPDPSSSPLDAEERALAEALRSLPSIEPDAALDARILAMAREAVAKAATNAPRKRRPPAGLWWLGSAAGAVLAAGIGWQLSQQQGHELDGGGNSQIGAQRTLSEAPAAKTDEGFDIELIRRPPTESTAASSDAADALAPKASDAEAARVSRAAADRQRASTTATAPAAPPSERRQAAAAELRTAAPPTPPDATQAETSVGESAGAMPGAQKPTRGDTPLDRIEVTGNRVRAGAALDEQGFPAVSQDARLKPEDWLLRVRARRDAGQAEQAHKSLQDFVRSYPYLVVPEDLRPLLNERP